MSIKEIIGVICFLFSGLFIFLSYGFFWMDYKNANLWFAKITPHLKVIGILFLICLLPGIYLIGFFIATVIGTIIIRMKENKK